jgi:hypothetical protein
MGEAAKAFWVEEEELAELETENEFDDVSFLSTGISDHLWKLGSD